MQLEEFVKSLTELSKNIETPAEGSLITSSDLKIVGNDVTRTYFRFSAHSKNQIVLKFYRNVLYELFSTMKLTYYQGMSDIASVILDAFLTHDVENLNLVSETFDAEREVEPSTVSEVHSELKGGDNHKKAQVLKKSRSLEDLTKLREEFKEDSPEAQNEIVFESDFHFTKPENKQILKDFMLAKAEKLKIVSIVLNGIFFEKYIFLAKDGFAPFKKGSRVYTQMMKNRNIPINFELEMLIMSHVFTFFIRDLQRLSDIYQMLDFVARNEPEMLFSICVLLNEELDLPTNPPDPSIKSLPANFSAQAKTLHGEYKVVAKTIDDSPVKTFLVSAVAVSIAAVGFAILYRKSK